MDTGTLLPDSDELIFLNLCLNESHKIPVFSNAAEMQAPVLSFEVLQSGSMTLRRYSERNFARIEHTIIHTDPCVATTS